MKNYLIRGSVLALTLGVAGLGSLYAQESKPSQNDQAQPAQSQPAQNNSQASPTSAVAMASRIAGEGLVTVSERRSTR